MLVPSRREPSTEKFEGLIDTTVRAEVDPS